MSTKTTSFTLVALAVAACGGAPPAPPERSLATSPAAAAQGARDPRLAPLDSMRAAIEARDARALAALYADDAVSHPAGGATLRGRAAIEAAAQRELAPAASMRFGFQRVWLKGDVVIAEAAFHAKHPPASGLRDVGATELAIFWFDGAGRIAREHSYLDRSGLLAQAAGEADAPPLPAVPTSPEVFVAIDGAADAKTIAWAHAFEAALTRDDSEALSFYDERVRFDCALGFHGESRADLEKPLKGWRAAFPDQKWTATAIWPVGDYVIVEETFTGTHKGKFGSLDASGRPITWRWAEVWQVKDGRIARGWSWANYDELEVQVTGRPGPRAHARVACSGEP